jgi:sugar lactone lactonase YvrE
LYVTDTYVSAIRKITTGYGVSTLPQPLGENGYQGFRDGSGPTALFYIPVGITSDASGNIYVADSMNCALRTVDAGNIVATLVGASACTSNTALPFPKGVSTASDGNIYVGAGTDPFVAQVTPSGQVTILAGSPNDHGFADGVGQAARFSDITGVAADDHGNVYVADSTNNTIRKIDIASRTVSTLAGNPQQPPASVDGIGSAARFRHPCGIEADPAGNVYVAECETHAIRKVTPAGVVTTLAGTAGISGYVDGAAAGSLFSYPQDVTLDADGNLYVVDEGNLLIRKITPAGIVSTVAGTKGLHGQTIGPLPGSLNYPVGIHARTISGGNVELLVTIDEGVIRITTPR